MTNVEESVSLALDDDGAAPVPKWYKRTRSQSVQYSAKEELGIKLNSGLDGYQFTNFSEHFICREELPNGSNIFQQVLDEISESLTTTQIKMQPQQDSPKTRRKSTGTFKPNVPRKVHWGNTTEQKISAFRRSRVLSDGAIVRSKFKDGS